MYVGVRINKVWSVPHGEYKCHEQGHESSNRGPTAIQAVINNLIRTQDQKIFNCGADLILELNLKKLMQ